MELNRKNDLQKTWICLMANFCDKQRELLCESSGSSIAQSELSNTADLAQQQVVHSVQETFSPSDLSTDPTAEMLHQDVKI